MKLLFTSARKVLVAGFVFAALFAACATPLNYADKLTHARLFSEPLLWVGTREPKAQESYDLYVAAALDRECTV